MNHLITELELKVEKLEQEIKFKNGLISILSHDSKEIFGNFLWLTEAVEQETISQEDFFKLLPQVNKDAQKNLQTVQDSTAWLKTQYGEFQIKPVKINVLDLFHHLKENLGAQLKRKNIKFYFEGNEHESLETDRFLLEYVLEKIINNAVKYSMPGQEVYFQYVAEGNEAGIAIVDYGTGIGEKNLSGIFSFDNPLFKGTDGEIGVGLSLKIVKNFVSLMNGNMKILSTKNKGTTVSIFLPQM